jgi:hypothetical protein
VKPPLLSRAAAVAPLALLASCGEAAGSAMRASALLGLLALAAGAARRRWPARPVARELEVLSRTWLGRDAGVALVRARGESLLVGWGREGVRLLTRLGREDTP